MLNGLDLFSGIGGLSIALKPWVRTVAYCERDRYAQAVLLSRITSGELDRAPIWDDVTSLRGAMLPSIDIIFGGFPCQDISVAGNGAGLAGERSGLYSHIERLIRETNPTFVFLENVPAIRTRGLARVVWGLASLGYDLRWTVISAASVGAPHKRDRWFCLASNTKRIELRNESRRCGGKKWKGAAIVGNDGEKESMADTESFGCRQGDSNTRGCGERVRTQRAQVQRSTYSGEVVADANGAGWPGPNTPQPNGRDGSLESTGGCNERGWQDAKSWWSVEPNVGRVVDGFPTRVDRIRCLGNAVVPIQAREAFKILSGIGGIA